MPIEALGPGSLYVPPAEPERAGALAPEVGRGESFAAAIGDVLAAANQDQIDASAKVIDLTVRGQGDIHEAMVAVESAESSFRLLMEMRNRLLEGVSRLLETPL